MIEERLEQDEALSPSPVPGEGAPKGRMRASKEAAAPAYLTARARVMRREDTDAERMLWSDLRDRRLNGHRFVRQYVVKPYIVDFACRARCLVVELDGSQHSLSSYDGRRTGRLNSHGWSVLRFWNDEIIRDRRAVCETILAVLDGRLTQGSDGAGWIDGLRLMPGKPSPASLRSAPCPGTGEGEAPRPDALAEHLS